MKTFFFFFQAEDGIRDGTVTGVQTCALPISEGCVETRGESGTATNADGLPIRERRLPVSGLPALGGTPSDVFVRAARADRPSRRERGGEDDARKTAITFVRP